MQRDLRDIRALVRHKTESKLIEERVQTIPDSKVTMMRNNNYQRQSPIQMTSTPESEIVQISNPESNKSKEELVQEEESANLGIYNFLINNMDAIIDKLGIVP